MEKINLFVDDSLLRRVTSDMLVAHTDLLRIVLADTLGIDQKSIEVRGFKHESFSSNVEPFIVEFHMGPQWAPFCRQIQSDMSHEIGDFILRVGGLHTFQLEIHFRTLGVCGAIISINESAILESDEWVDEPLKEYC